MTMKGRRCWAGLSAATTVAALLSLGFNASAQDATRTPTAKATSSCQGLDVKACKGKAGECRWIVPTKGGQSPYCRLRVARSGKSARPPSPCQGLDSKACKGKTGECLWIVPTKGKQSPYCRMRTARRK